ncbi:hypothetical protein CANINC_002717 [Pichia inconspicua]|uniref:Ino eighty subunit 1 n=1 Tax=Pichia inconspicua TaxID=52247 RepID=A0A4T0X230_9ASCO|nr:hypothetical protein CANINC_002717 [[Candida] inconspicua]
MVSLSSLLNPSSGNTESGIARSQEDPPSASPSNNTKSSTPMSITDIIMNQADQSQFKNQETSDANTTTTNTNTKEGNSKRKLNPQYNNTYSTSYTPVIPGYNGSYTDDKIKQISHVNTNNIDTLPNIIDTTNTKIDDNEHMRTYQTLLINSRSRHLKKNDAEPYWRNEIQFKFLMSLFFNHNRVFKNPYFNTFHGFDWPNHFKFFKDENGNIHENNGEMLNFFELYLITLLKSTKISKILKARLMVDIHYALNFSIICLLVNIGRLNTTVNFDYEMRSQFRTYHSIPSLQVTNHDNIIEKYYPISSNTSNEIDLKINDNGLSLENGKIVKNKKNTTNYTTSTVKQLQDTPRIKSILKSVNDLSSNAPKSYAEFIQIISNEFHGMNIVSVIFFICANEYEIGQSFFPFDLTEPTNSKSSSTGSLLNDIWLRPKLKSSDKLQKFLWLIYTIMETGLSLPKILSNPFNNQSASPIELDNSTNLVSEISFIDHKKPYLSPTILKLKSIIPKWSSIEQQESIDPLLNDFDTAQEVEFAAQMKRLRVEFVENETQNTTITNIRSQKDNIDEKNTQIDLKLNAKTTGQKIGARKRARTGSNEFSSRFYNPDGTEIELKDDSLINHNDTTIDEQNKTIAEDGTIVELSDEELDERILNDTLSDFNPIETENEYILKFEKPKKRAIDESVEMSAINPLILSSLDDNFEDNDAIGFFNYGYTGSIVSDIKRGIDGSPYVTSCVKKRKARKQIYADRAIKNSFEKLLSFLNKDYKNINSLSKNASNRREKNKAVAEFIYDLIQYKQSQAHQLRMIEGNWKHFTKHSWDLNMLIEKETDKIDNLYGDWGEFKTSLNKALHHINIVINERIKINSKIGQNGNDELKSHVSFIDDVFKSL